MELIVIGGSEGGAAALRRVVLTFPKDFPAAVAVVLHTLKRTPRLSASILAEATDLRVEYAQDGSQLEAGIIYMAPPGHHLVVAEGGELQFDDGPPVQNAKPAADLLFSSAAKMFGTRVIGVVLSGADGDGTDGLKAIKACGGLSVVQSPFDSVAPGMAMNALMYDDPDHILMLDEIGPFLVRLIEERSVQPQLAAHLGLSPSSINTSKVSRV